MKDFKKLKVWEKSHHLALKVYGATQNFPGKKCTASRVKCDGLLFPFRRILPRVVAEIETPN
jgi:hypothetical protein